MRALLAALTGAATLIAVGPLPQATANPPVAEIERQIDQAWNQVEPVIEEHNLVRTKLKERRKAANKYAKEIAPLSVKVDAAMGKVGELATVRYKGGSAGAMNAILETGSPTELIQRLGVLDQFARRQAASVRDVTLLRDQLAAKKAPLDAMVAELARTEAELAAKAKKIDADIKKLEKLRLAAYGTGGGTGSLRPVPCPTNYPGGDAGRVIRFACAQIGKPYVWAAAGPGSFDCSGLMLAAWRRAGVSLPHNAAAQRRAMGNISKDELRAGDFVFYYGDLHHVGMYAGKINGTHWVVHAPQSGDRVRMVEMDKMPVHSYGRP
ncbi:C40 family peptidase [Pilimelia columellifera]